MSLWLSDATSGAGAKGESLIGDQPFRVALTLHGRIGEDARIRLADPSDFACVAAEIEDEMT